MKTCQYCKRIIIEDFPKWIKENPNQEYLQCPYCHHLEKLGVAQETLNIQKEKKVGGRSKTKNANKNRKTS